MLPVPPPLSVTSGKSPSLLGSYLCLVQIKYHGKSKTSTFSPHLGIFCFFNDSFIISPNRPYLFTSKYKLSLGEGVGEERTLFSLCSISFQRDTQFTVKANSPNESGCAVAAPCVSSAPRQGQCQGNGEQDVSHIPCSSQHTLLAGRQCMCQTC